MSSIVLALTLLVTPSLLGASVVRVGARPWERLGGLLALGGLLPMLVLAAPWPWVGLPTRWIVLAGGLGCMVVGAGRLARTGLRRPARAELVWLLVGLLLGPAFGWQAIQALKGRVPDRAAVALSFPLEGGRFVVGNGGRTPVVNGHGHVRAQRYALDIEALGPWGWRASGLYPDKLDAYAVWDAAVVAPCAGEILAATDGLSDLPPGQVDRVNLAGNHVVLFCEAVAGRGVTVLLAHFRQGTVAVTATQRVEVGAALGRVGNTGNTSEPHLHVHAVRGRQEEFDTVAFLGEAAPMTFDGRFLVRNDVVASPR
ncbi:MAG: M23 family metallopeptidase [Myxococcota bacterium]